MSDERLSLIMKSARKFKGITQQELARALKCSQSALSKMENGVLIPSAPQWFDFCKITEIPVESLAWGFIDRRTVATVVSDRKANGHNLPSRYSQNRGIKIKHVVPFMDYLFEVSGEECVTKFLKKHKMTPEYFVDLDNQVSANFVYDLFQNLKENNKIDDENIRGIVKNYGKEKTHGQNYRDLINTSTPLEALETYVDNYQYYQSDIKLSLDVSDANILLKLKPEEHLSSFKIFRDKDFCNFFEGYLLRSLEVITGLNKSGRKLSGINERSYFENGEETIFSFALDL